jgi:catechol 2,3-dioxygenase-like lactoylglutathione lyase family enzyme
MLPTTVLQPFVPGGPDFDSAKHFYRALGFTLDFESEAGDIAGFSCAAGKFLLSNAVFAGWNDNFMMSLTVPDLDAWWVHVEGLDLPGAFGVRAPMPPRLQPWGLTVAYVFAPGGPLWHIVQA